MNLKEKLQLTASIIICGILPIVLFVFGTLLLTSNNSNNLETIKKTTTIPKGYSFEGVRVKNFVETYEIYKNKENKRILIKIK